jgi:hypothetical protein
MLVDDWTIAVARLDLVGVTFARFHLSTLARFSCISRLCEAVADFDAMMLICLVRTKCSSHSDTARGVEAISKHTPLKSMQTKILENVKKILFTYRCVHA